MPTRRDIVSVLVTAAGSAAVGAALPVVAAAPRRIPQATLARVIVDNDFAGDPDSLVALAHHLLSPATRTVLVTTTAIDPKLSGPALADSSALAGRDIALELIRRLKAGQGTPVVAGPEAAGAHITRDDAARAIVAEALREDDLPLFFCCGGPLTNLAAALRINPSIAQRMTVIWIGGSRYPEGGWEYNLSVDVAAARAVIEQSRVPLWQVPQNAYRQMVFSIAEMTQRMRPLSPFTAWLYDQFTSPPSFVKIGGAWPMGDSPPVLLTAISTESSTFTDRTAQRILDDLRYGDPIPGRSVRVYDTLDARITFEDFLARLRLHSQR
jgi:hypothetical protein